MSAVTGIIPAALAAFGCGVRRLLEVVLHIGAHRTGTTTLQHHLHLNRDNLTKNGIAVWGPERTRAGLFTGLIRAPAPLSGAQALRGALSSARIRREIAALREAGHSHLLVSEENMIGDIRTNLAAGALYPQAAARLGALGAGFGADCTSVAVALRSYDSYWASAIAYAIRAGLPLPDAAGLARLAGARRGWRQVLRETAAAFPGARLVVWDFDTLKGRIGDQLALMVGGLLRPALAGPAGHHNASGSRDLLRARLAARGDHAAAARIPPGKGPFMPFGPAARDAMRARYAGDLEWLRDGADGIARFWNEAAGNTPAETTAREEWIRDGQQEGLGAAR
ncbi:hypothetical protein DDZ14_03275 [Maritimibacter sp. 55A14]|uniref:hypothetical protein n=1 Tax=Maritimibacter sp. 55A14 TaxID=2174844 RepID=UPI000D622D2E|nr:hypothetical protein [Maritimibacter sp. 55A14]PWE33703.1 hypothetical protein DDZ14_03275 [Maritimibacter sp. 55A14]